MFFIPRVNVIESDEGFIVEVLGRVGVRYTEGTRTMFVDSEVLAPNSPSGLVVYQSSIKGWDAPHDAEAFGGQARERVLDNIRRAFRFRGLEIEVI